ncbi:PH domain-containing protein [Actinomycetes bacterium M1A6_2h]
MSSPQQSEPPSTVSHTPASAPSQVIRVQPLALAVVALCLFGASFPALGWPLGFGWLLILPIVAGYWVLRVRTTVTPDGLRTRSMFSSRTVPWSEVSGLRFPTRRWARAALTDGTEVVLPVVTIDDLPRVAAASGGHVPDPTPPEDDETDETEKVGPALDENRPDPSDETS